MKKMPKLLSGAMALALVACMGTTAFAAEGSTDYNELNENKQSQHIVTVNATVGELGTVYSVNVAWTNLDFTWAESTPASWNDEQHEAVEAQGTWSADGKGSVTVTNDSNADVYAKITYAEDGDYTTNLKDKGVTVETVAVDTATKLNAGDSENITPQLTGDHQNQIQAIVTVSGVPTADISNATAGTFTAVVGTTESLD